MARPANTTYLSGPPPDTTPRVCRCDNPLLLEDEPRTGEPTILRCLRCGRERQGANT